MSHSATPPRATPIRPYEVDTVELMAALPEEQAELVAQLVRERDNLFVLHEALVAADQAGSLQMQLRVLVEAIRRVGFGRVTLTLRDGAMEPTMFVAAGLTAEQEADLGATLAGGDVWRRRLEQLEPFRVGQSYYLDARDPWVREEFAGGVPSALEPSDDPDWTPQDTLLIPLHGAEGDVLALLLLDDPTDRRRPPLTRVRTVELFGQQIAGCIERGRLGALAGARAARLQRLQEAGASLSRLLDEREVLAELARQAARLVPAREVTISLPTAPTADGTSAPPMRVSSRLAVASDGSTIDADPEQTDTFDGPVAEAARTGDIARGAADGTTATAVPLRAGRELLGVLAVMADRPALEPEDDEALLTLAAQAATAVANARRYAESERERRQSEALADVARAVGESLRLGEVLRLILRHATALLRCGGAAVGLRREDYLHVVAGVGDAQVLTGSTLPMATSVAGRVASTGEFAIVNNVPDAQAIYPPAARIASVDKTLMVPLIVADGPIGALAVINRAIDFTEEDARILQRLADHVAVAIVNARLFEEVDEARREWSVAFDAVTTGMAVLDADGRVTRANARAASLLEATEAEALRGERFGARLLGEPRSADDSDPVASALGGSPARDTLRAGDGRVFDVVAAPHPSGGAVVTFEDVTTMHTLAERYRRVVETTGDAIVITDLERRVLFANPAASRLFGLPQLVGRSVDSLIAPEVAEEVLRYERFALAGTPQRYESVVIRPDGERRVISVSTAPLQELGEVTGVVGSLRDVTDERRARDAVVQSEARYRNLFETATDAIYTVSPAGFFTSVNEATCRAAGVARDALLGRKIAPLLLPEERPRVRRAFDAALAGEAVRYECTLVRPDGVRRQLSVSNTPIRNGGEMVGVLGVARDVTDERARAAALARSEARYTRLVESASDGIVTVDLEGRFTSINEAMVESTGMARTALLGARFADLVDIRDRAAVNDLFARTMEGLRGKGALRYPGADGVTRSASVLTAPVVQEGVVVGGLAVVRDVTEERRLTEQMLQQEKLAAVGQLVSGVAHELNNPLASVMAFSQLLLGEAALDGDARQSAETIHAEAKRAAKIVGNLLTFARRHQPERALTDLNQVALDTLELRRYALRVSQIELDVDLDAALPCTWADPFQLQQVVLNLLANAEHALTDWSDERRITLSTSIANDMITLRVSDTGPGIAPEAAARIFNPFYTTKPVGQGTGLGLSISDGIVREHGGRIRVESGLTGGATFVVELPVIEAPPLEPLPVRGDEQ